MTRSLPLLSSLALLTACGAAPDLTGNLNNQVPTEASEGPGGSGGSPTVGRVSELSTLADPGGDIGDGGYDDDNNPGDEPDDNDDGDEGGDGQGSTSGSAGLSLDLIAGVRVVSWDHGQAELIAQADVDAEGHFEVDCPEGRDHLVIEVVDELGVRLGAVLDADGGEGQWDNVVAAIDAETSLEVRIWEAMIAEGHDPDDLDMNDLRSRIFADAAVEIEAIVAEHGDADFEIRAVARAILAGWAAVEEDRQQHGYGELDAAAMVAATLELMETFDQSSHDGQDTATSSRGYLDAQVAVLAELGLDAETRSREEKEFNLALRAVLQATLGESYRSQAFLDVMLTASARNEAHACHAHTLDLLDELDLSAAVALDVQAASESMVDDMWNAHDSLDVALAAAVWADVLLDGDDGAMSHFDEDGGLLDLLDLDGLLEVVIDLTLGLVIDLEDDLHGPWYDADTSSWNAGQTGSLIVGLWADFSADITSMVEDDEAFEGQTDLAAALLIEANGSFTYAD